MSDLLLRAGSTAHGSHELDVTPERAGWTWTGLCVLTLAPGERVPLDLTRDEAVVLPLAGAAVVERGSTTSVLDGRTDVFAGPAGAAFLPVGTDAVVASPDGARVAVGTARTTTAVEPATIGRDDVVIEVRGAGDATRVVRRYALGGPLAPHRVMIVEVLTPSGNWSSYPPHKHDTHSDDERELEEIYYFEARSRAPVSAGGSAGGLAGVPAGRGHGYHRQDDPDAPGGQLLAEVRTGDVALVPGGYHGPCAAPPGNDLYYLNVMAGPVADGSWLTTDHPDLAWVRQTWRDDAPDPRIGGGGELS